MAAMVVSVVSFLVAFGFGLALALDHWGCEWRYLYLRWTEKRRERKSELQWQTARQAADPDQWND